MSFTVYEQTRHNYASVHRATCRYIRMHGGGDSDSPGKYHEGFETAEAALACAESTNRHVRICQTCRPL